MGADSLGSSACELLVRGQTGPRPCGISMLVPEAYFYDRDNVWINERAFGTRRRSPEMTKKDLRQVADFT